MEGCDTVDELPGISDESAPVSAREWLADHLPDWGPVRWTALLLALLIVAISGISLIFTPDYETVYSCSAIRVPPVDTNVLVIATVNIGNTGRKAQPDVKLRFLASALSSSIMPPSARNYGVSERTIGISTNGSEMEISLGEIEPTKRVELRLTMAFPADKPIPGWNSLFLGIQPSLGKARKGDPDMVRYGRFLYALFGG